MSWDAVYLSLSLRQSLLLSVEHRLVSTAGLVSVSARGLRVGPEHAGMSTRMMKAEVVFTLAQHVFALFVGQHEDFDDLLSTLIHSRV